METLYQLSYSPEAATNDSAADAVAHPARPVGAAASRQAGAGDSPSADCHPTIGASR